jgi:chromosome partitioning protein
MITHEEVLKFLRKRPTLSKTGLNKEAALPIGTLTKAMSGQRTLNDDHLNALEPVLRQYGLDEFLTRRAIVLAVVNHKGGVGKTTTAINLGRGLANRGQSVLLIDMDSQGNLSQSLGVHNPEKQLFHALTQQAPIPILPIKENYHIVPSDLELARAETELIKTPSGVLRFRNVLAPQLTNYDFILIDCPPSLNIFTYSALVASTSALVVLEPESSAVKGMYNLIELIQDIKESFNSRLNIIGIIMTRVSKLVLHRELMGRVRADLAGHTIFSTEIRQNVALAESQYAGQDIFDYQPESNGAADYQTLADELLVKYHV